MRTRVKICGITSAKDAAFAVEFGADAIGLVFYPPSPRAVSISQAIKIVQELPPFVSAVGLFVNADFKEIKETIEQVRLDMLQFHGEESATDCTRFNMPYMKAIRVRPEANLIQCVSEYHRAKALLLDTYVAGVAGGTGQTFDWKLIPQLNMPIILAGGLDAQNVGVAIKTVNPYAVDVSGGVEKSKGIKDAAKIAAFMDGVKNAAV